MSYNDFIFSDCNYCNEGRKVTKFQELKQAVQNPPPERLAAIEYKSHFLNMLGIAIVCILLIAKGFWYIIFAFIFGIGISYSQGMSAYAKWVAISNLTNPIAIDEERSPTRRRSRIIDEIFGFKIKLMVTIVSVLLATFILYPGSLPWYGKTAYVLLIFVIWPIIYYFPAFWLANSIYNKDMKGGKENGKTKKRN